MWSKYVLEGFQNQWSDWNTKTVVNFKNLPSGDYVLKLKEIADSIWIVSLCIVLLY
jgi:hypothetical protein